MGLPSVGVAATIGRFVAGHVITVSQKLRPKKWKGPDIDLEQLEGLDEAWVLCYRRPRPGWRLFGRFIEHDALGLFAVKDRRDIGNDYETPARDMIAEWEKWLPSQEPHRGDDLRAYISGSFYNVDEIP